MGRRVSGEDAAVVKPLIERGSLSVDSIVCVDIGQPPYLPKYYVIKEQILALVEGTAPGTVVPTERTLAVQYSTSRTTVRQAVGELVAEGRLERTQGRGDVRRSAERHSRPAACLVI